MASALDRIFLNVPFDEKAEAKRAGAYWDVDERGWWIESTKLRASFDRWLPRMFRLGAKQPYIVSEMVPEPCWFVNCRSLLPVETWDRLRRDCYERAGRRCQVCGGRGPDWPVECNEQWQYIENPASPGQGVQKLVRLVALCPTCHTIKHLGRAQIDGRYEAAIEQLCYVNGWDETQAEAHARQAFFTWERRSAMEWAYDLSVMRSWGIERLELSAYDVDPIPLIEGLEVVVHLTCAMQFDAAAEGVTLRQLAAAMSDLATVRTQ